MKDPAFLFYPGDYLRDTQCLSETVQVSYDRIMCEHMRNICISKQQLKFFTKRLNPDELEELMMVLNEFNGGYQIHWVAESIAKRKLYSESRRKNRSNPKKDIIKISNTYDKHMENENENENEIEDKKEIIYPFDSGNFLKYWDYWKSFKKEQFKFIYKPIGEQGALKDLSELSKGKEKIAIKIIEQSICKGWKGFFEIKTNYENTDKYSDMKQEILNDMNNVS